MVKMMIDWRNKNSFVQGQLFAAKSWRLVEKTSASFVHTTAYRLIIIDPVETSKATGIAFRSISGLGY